MMASAAPKPTRGSISITWNCQWCYAVWRSDAVGNCYTCGWPPPAIKVIATFDGERWIPQEQAK